MFGGLQPFWFHLSIFALFVALTLLLAFVVLLLLWKSPRSAPAPQLAAPTAEPEPAAVP